MRIKHSKYKNTALIYEMLVKQLTSDLIHKNNSPALKLIKKYFSNNSPLVSELKLYNYVLQNKPVQTEKAESILNSVLEISKKLDEQNLQKLRYNLIKEIKTYYNINQFFTKKINNYKALAALYCLFEIYNTKNIIDPEILNINKQTVVEYLISKPTELKKSIVQEYTEFDEDLKTLTYQIFIKKFNEKYKELLPEQKQILKEVLITVGDLSPIVNKKLEEVKTLLEKHKSNIKDNITSIKLNEIISNIKPVSETVTTKDLYKLLQYYELNKHLV